VSDIVNSHEEIKRAVEMLRKSELAIRSYRTTSSFQFDDVSTESNDVIVDEVKTKESQKLKPHQEEPLHPTITTTSTSSTTDQNNDTKETDCVLLKVRLDDDIVKFKLRKTDPLQKLLDGFCQKKNLEKSKTRLSFDGLNIDLDKTPEDLDMVRKYYPFFLLLIVKKIIIILNKAIYCLLTCFFVLIL